MKPVVGVIPLWDDEKNSIWMLPGYMEGIRKAGAIPIIFPLTDNEEEICCVMDMVQGVLYKKFFWALQWHPEFAFEKDEIQRKIFEEFVKSMID